jgi:CheY-like chemotaxis protein
LNDILDFSKIEAGRMELSPTEFQLDDVLNTLGAIMGMNTAAKDLDLAIVIAPDVPQCLYGDAMRLQQILINLCANAIKFTDQGEVTLLIRRTATASTRQIDQATGSQPDHAPNLQADPIQVQLEFLVRDTGIGIDAEQQARLFSAFNQADSSTTRRFGGTGLGLTISRKLAHLMQGEISLHSQTGQGSEFSLKLPLQQVVTQALVPPIGRLHLLLIDDNLSCRNAFANIIQSWNSHLDCCASLQEALDLQAHGTHHYDAIVADWQLLADQPLPPALTRAPLILTCNLRGKQELIERQGQGDSVLLKPVTSSGLYDTLHHVLPNPDQNRASSTSKKLAERRIVGARLLLVEDNPLNQLVAQSMLVRAGASVDVVNNGYEAVEILRWKAAQYDLVLMDVQMPVMDGFAATSKLRHDLHLTLPVLAMTAGVLPSEQEKCRSAGMDAIISKPIHFEEMISTILRHLPAHAIRPPPDEIINGEALLEICEAQPEFLPTLVELIRRMMAQSQPQLQQVRQHVSQGQNEAAAIILHGMRGSIGFLDAKAFSATALALENAIRADDQTTIPALLDATDESLQQVLLAVQPWLAKLA